MQSSIYTYNPIFINHEEVVLLSGTDFVRFAELASLEAAWMLGVIIFWRRTSNPRGDANKLSPVYLYQNSSKKNLL